MPVIFQFRYYRDDARRNPDVLYVFGDNVARQGFGGQAKEMRGEPNAIGVATKCSPIAFFGNEPAEVLAQNRSIDHDMKPLFAHLLAGGIVIWPTDGIGTGLSEMPRYAPRSFEHLEQKLAALIRVGKLFPINQHDALEEAEAHI